MRTVRHEKHNTLNTCTFSPIFMDAFLRKSYCKKYHVKLSSTCHTTKVITLIPSDSLERTPFLATSTMNACDAASHQRTLLKGHTCLADGVSMLASNTNTNYSLASSLKLLRLIDSLPPPTGEGD